MGQKFFGTVGQKFFPCLIAFLIKNILTNFYDDRSMLRGPNSMSKQLGDRPTDRLTDRQTDRATYRASWRQLKKVLVEDDSLKYIVGFLAEVSLGYSFPAD